MINFKKKSTDFLEKNLEFTFAISMPSAMDKHYLVSVYVEDISFPKESSVGHVGHVP